MKKLIALVGFGIAGLCSSPRADIYLTADPVSPGANATALQNALSSAVTGEVIYVPEGVYSFDEETDSFYTSCGGITVHGEMNPIPQDYLSVREEPRGAWINNEFTILHSSVSLRNLIFNKQSPYSSALDVHSGATSAEIDSCYFTGSCEVGVAIGVAQENLSATFTNNFFTNYDELGDAGASLSRHGTTWRDNIFYNNRIGMYLGGAYGESDFGRVDDEGGNVYNQNHWNLTISGEIDAEYLLQMNHFYNETGELIINEAEIRDTFLDTRPTSTPASLEASLNIMPTQTEPHPLFPLQTTAVGGYSVWR